MRKNYFIFLLSLLLFSFHVKGQEKDFIDDIYEALGFRKCESQKVVFDDTYYICNGNTWKLVFEDNFDGNALDLSKWEAYTGVLRDFSFDNQKAWHKPENVIVENGLLKIISKRENLYNMPVVTNWNPYTVKYENFDYTTGEISTRLDFLYGKLEARIKIPKGWGLWPAFWMYGETKNTSGDKINNEIDVFEFWNEKKSSDLAKIHHMTVHYNSNYCATKYIGNDFSTDFHVFTMRWNKDKIYFYVDDVLKSTYIHYVNILGQEVGCYVYPSTLYVEKPYPRDPMSIILNVAIQHNKGNDPDNTTPLPSQMEVDYVRFYQRLPCYDESTTITTPSMLNIRDKTFSSVVGSTIKMGDSFTLENKQHLMARATDKIVLKPGFAAKAGSSFTAKIDSLACKANKGTEDEMNDEDTLTREEDTEIVPKRMGLEEMVSDINVFPNPLSDRLFVEISYCYEKTIRYKI